MLSLIVAFGAIAHATIYSSDLTDGVVWNVDYTSEHEVHFVEVDLSAPGLYLRVSREDEAPMTTSAFAELSDSIVTINGDWVDTDYSRPLGLSVGDGWQWTDSHDWDGSINPPGDWSFLACRASKECFFDDENSYQEWDWVWQNVVGGNGDRLIVDGELRTPVWDSNQRPRSGVCLDTTGTLMILVVAEGDEAGENGIGSWLEGTDYTFDGFTPSEFAAYMYDLGCWNAMSFDGGGSSDLALNGARVNDRSPSEPDERSLYSHLSVLQSDTVDTACASVPNGRFCSAEVLSVCQGGMEETLDCGFYGWSCEEEDDTAFCVDPVCTNGGMNDVCEDDSVIVQCNHGQTSEFNCGDYGYSCEDTTDSAQCTHPDCPYGGDASWCEDDVLKSCESVDADGLLVADPAEDVDCTETGQICLDGACVDAAESGDSGTADGDSDSDTDDTTDTDTDTDDTTDTDTDAGTAEGEDYEGGATCATTNTPHRWSMWAWGIGFLIWVRRRPYHVESVH